MSRPFGSHTGVVKADAKMSEYGAGKKVMEWDLLANDQFSKYPIRLRCRSYIANAHGQIDTIREGCLMTVMGEFNAEAFMMKGREKPVAALIMNVTRFEVHPVVLPIPTVKAEGDATPPRPAPRQAPRPAAATAPPADDGGADDVPF